MTPASAGEPSPSSPEADWFDLGNGQRDFLFSALPGAEVRRSTVHIDGVEHPFRVMLTRFETWIQLPPDTAYALCGDVAVTTMFRRAGVRRERTDWSTPLLVPADRMWVQAEGGTVLIWRLDAATDRLAFFRLSKLPPMEPSLIEMFGTEVRVLFLIADDFLPRASWQHFGELVTQHRAFGGCVTFDRDVWLP